jgi:hypothetical protein
LAARSELECENRDFFLDFLSSQIERQDLVGLGSIWSAFGVLEGPVSVAVSLPRPISRVIFWESIACWRGGGCEIAGRLPLRCLGLGK